MPRATPLKYPLALPVLAAFVWPPPASATGGSSSALALPLSLALDAACEGALDGALDVFPPLSPTALDVFTPLSLAALDVLPPLSLAALEGPISLTALEAPLSLPFAAASPLSVSARETSLAALDGRSLPFLPPSPLSLAAWLPAMLAARLGGGLGADMLSQQRPTETISA